MTTYPDHLPGQAQDIPDEVKRFLRQRVLEKQLEIQGGEGPQVVASLRRPSAAAPGPSRRGHAARAGRLMRDVLYGARLVLLVVAAVVAVTVAIPGALVMLWLS